MAASTDHIDAGLIRSQLGSAYGKFSAAEQSQHVGLVNAVRRRDDIALHAEERPGGRWLVTICSADHVGSLSILAGLFAAYRMNIISADIFTVRVPRDPSTTKPPPLPGRRRWSFQTADEVRPLRVVLDIFEIQALQGADPAVWDAFRQDLTTPFSLLAAGHAEQAKSSIIDRFSEAIRQFGQGQEPLYPVTVEIENSEAEAHTKLTIRSTDTVGFLFEFTNALSMLNVNIERAEVRTVNGETDDTLWVTDARGGKIVDSARVFEIRVAAALIKQFTHLLPRSPNPAQALRQFSALIKQMLSRPDWTENVQDLESLSVLNTLAEMMGVSRFLWEDFLRMQHDNLFPVLVDTPSLRERSSPDLLRTQLQQQLAGAAAFSERVRILNEFKDREMFRIDLRHITQRIGFRRFSEDLTALAEVAVGEAARLCHEALRERFSLPDEFKPAPWLVCGLGKFGGRELGFGSDIELVFVYDDAAGTEEQTAAPAIAQYYEELVRLFMTTIKASQEGIFQVDLRLRPYGNAGAMAIGLTGFRQYYMEGGPAQQFERMALVKLRPVAGDPELGERVERVRDDFVYSGKPLDYEDIRHLRHRQATELVSLGAVNAKYSPGGLVDVEYFVQARQIEAAYADTSVRTTNTSEAIDRLTHAGVFEAAWATDLSETYAFLRRLIDALRVVRGNAKDLTIPQSDSREFAYLTRRLGYDAPAALQTAIDERMRFARTVWDEATA